MSHCQGITQINDVFAPVRSLSEIRWPVRVIDCDYLRSAILIRIDPGQDSAPFSLDYTRWIELVSEEYALERITDPYLHLSSSPTKLPEGANKRLKVVIEVTKELSEDPLLLHSSGALSAKISRVAQRYERNPRTIRRWVHEWLRAGRNPAASVHTFINRPLMKALKPQEGGRKRGRAAINPDLSSAAPAHEVAETINRAYRLFVHRQGMTYKSAYFEMLAKLCGIPRELINGSGAEEFLLSPALITKYRPPTWYQFRYRVRLLAAQNRLAEDTLPRGKRGKATDEAPGPGFFEIDATHF